MACPHADRGNPDCIRRGLATICKRLITDSAMPFWKWTCGMEYWVSMPAVQQKSSKVFEINSPAPSTCKVRIG